MAYRLALRVLPGHCHTSSERDFTNARLFACLAVREFFRLSYRRTEALLRDSPQWLDDIGLACAPDHNTLWRAFGSLVRARRCQRMLDELSRWFKRSARSKTRVARLLAIDSTCFERHHRSVHYDRRCRRMEHEPRKRPGKWGKSVNASRQHQLMLMPKLSIAVDAACHLILAAKVRLGNCSDAPDFHELLHEAHRRAKVRVVLADGGYDSEANHRIAREDLGVESIIPAAVGRPTSKLPTTRWRRLMAKQFKNKSKQKQYAQRSQSETTHSMLKRNLGSALRSRTPERQKQEMMLRAIVHNITLLCDDDEA
jgi:hypothetical protein